MKYKIYKEERETHGGQKQYRIYAKVGNWWIGSYYLIPYKNIYGVDWQYSKDYIQWNWPWENINYDIEKFKKDIELYIQNQKDKEIKSFKKELIG